MKIIVYKRGRKTEYNNKHEFYVNVYLPERENTGYVLPERTSITDLVDDIICADDYKITNSKGGWL